MGKSAGGSGGGLVLRSYPDKSVKLTVQLRPADAAKLRVAAVGLGLDLGDLVTLALEPVLRALEVTVRLRPGGVQSSPINGTDADGSGGSPGDMVPSTVRMTG